MILQVNLKNIKNHFFFFYMKEHGNGTWLSPIGDMKKYWQYCFELKVYGDTILARDTEIYDGSQEMNADFEADEEEEENILYFDFPDEETALYFQMKFCS